MHHVKPRIFASIADPQNTRFILSLTEICCFSINSHMNSLNIDEPVKQSVFESAKIYHKIICYSMWLQI